MAQSAVFSLTNLPLSHKLYVLLGNEYVYPPNPPNPMMIVPTDVLPGKLVEVFIDHNGEAGYRTLAEADIDSDPNLQRIAVSESAVYFAAGAMVDGQRSTQILRHDLKNGETSVFLPAADPGFNGNPPFIAGLAVMPR